MPVKKWFKRVARGLAIAGILFLLYLLVVPSPLINEIHSPVGKSHESMRAVVTVLEAYHTEDHAYPATHPIRDFAGWHKSWLKEAGGWDLNTIEPGSARIAGLTTPKAYLERMPRDIFTEGRRMPFAYDQGSKGWILFSPGPDGQYDIQPEVMGHLDQNDRWDYLVDVKCDPTNGSGSRGDISRFGE